MQSKVDLYDVYHGKELVIADEDFSSSCHGRSTGEYCGGCGMCMEMQAYHSGCRLVKVSTWKRQWRDWIYYPVLHVWYKIRKILPKKDVEWP